MNKKIIPIIIVIFASLMIVSGCTKIRSRLSSCNQDINSNSSTIEENAAQKHEPTNINTEATKTTEDTSETSDKQTAKSDTSNETTSVKDNLDINNYIPLSNEDFDALLNEILDFDISDEFELSTDESLKIDELFNDLE